jgi:hypothetical protein
MNQVRLGPAVKTALSRAADATHQVVTPRYEKFLEENREIVYSPRVINMVTESLYEKQESRTGRLGGSSAGACLRAQVLGYLGAPGTPVDTDLQKIFEDGKWRHMRLQATLLEAGIIDRIEVPARWRRARAFGQIDGAGVVPDDHPNEAWRGKEFGLEIKGAMSFAFANIEKAGPERYYEQISRYFLYAGFELFVIIVESKDTQRTLEWVISEEDVNVGAQLHELQVLNDYIDLQQLPPKIATCALARGPQFHSCPYGKTTAGSCHNYDERW